MTDAPPGSAHGRVRFAETADISRLLADAPGVRTALLAVELPSGRVVEMVTRRHPPPEMIVSIALYSTSLGK